MCLSKIGFKFNFYNEMKSTGILIRIVIVYFYENNFVFILDIFIDLGSRKMSYE